MGNLPEEERVDLRENEWICGMWDYFSWMVLALRTQGLIATFTLM